MALHILTQAELQQVSGAAYTFPTFGFANGGPTGMASYDTPFGTFSGNGYANPTDGGQRTVSYTGIFGTFGNTAGFGPNGPVFSNVFQPSGSTGFCSACGF